MFRFAWLLLSAVGIAIGQQQPATDVVQTLDGPISGLREKASDATVVRKYLGVPFAAPPIQKLRFAPPKRVTPWTTTKKCEVLANTCFHTLDTTYPGFRGMDMWNGANVTEDCLQLNLWVPQRADYDGQVLVWIFGGGFFSGSPSLNVYNALELAARGNTIVVNINYRLGPFGFLYFGRRSQIPGNMGLLDQRLGLQWVHDNIAKFGGDPKKVTIFGESAGGSSVAAHLLSPQSRSYFSKVIMQSGNTLNPWATHTPHRGLLKSVNLARAVGCGKVRNFADCLRTRSPEDIQKAANGKAASGNRILEFSFVPISADANFFQSDSCINLKYLHTNNVPVLLGTNSDEGTYWLPYNLAKYGFKFDPAFPADSPENAELISRQQYLDAVNASFYNYVKPGRDATVIQSLAQLYANGALKNQSELNGTKETLRDGVSRMFADYFFVCDVIRFADQLWAKGTPVYMYHFTQRSTNNPWPKWMGVMHGYEIEYVFGQPLREKGNYQDEERVFSKDIIQLWTNFMRTGKPSEYWSPYANDGSCALLNAGTTKQQPLPRCGTEFYKHCGRLRHALETGNCPYV